MKLGVHVGYVVSRDHLFDQLKTVKAAEEFGYDSAWTAEAYGSDAATPLAWFASQTSKIKLGAAIFQIPGRTPGNCAMTATTLDCLSDGRFILGLGSSGPQVAEGWHGQPFAHQIQRTREYIEILRMMLGRQRAEYDGEIYKLPLPDGLGKPLKIMLPPEHAAGLNENLATGAARADRSMDEIAISPSVFAATGDGDIASLRDAIRPLMALYIGGMGARGKNFYTRLVSSYGYEEQALRVQDLYLDKKYVEAGAALPDELIDLVSLVGDRDRVAERIAAYRDVGVDNLLIVPMAADEGGRREVLRTVAEAAG
jgi:alkanesulfonate monooxygenase SsuD/methylene tetrahydromethanopterin reductase-like flavin-dependent oxidoreductase (luciferase family)